MKFEEFLDIIKRFETPQSDFIHPFTGFFDDESICMSTHFGLACEMANNLSLTSKLLKITNEDEHTIETQQITVSKMNYDFYTLEELLNNDYFVNAAKNNPNMFRNVLTIEYVINIGSIKGFVEDRIVVASSNMQKIYDILPLVKQNYVQKYASHISDTAFNTEKVVLRIKDFYVDNICAVSDTSFTSKNSVRLFEDVVPKLVGIALKHYAKDNNEEESSDEGRK